MTSVFFCASLFLVAIVCCGIGGAVGYFVAQCQHAAVLKKSGNVSATAATPTSSATEGGQPAANQPGGLKSNAARYFGKAQPAKELRKENQQLQADLSAAKQDDDNQSKQLSRHKRDARTDDLTMLLNRRALQELLADLVQGGQSGRSAGTLMLIHVDHFQTCNDTYGSCTGDRVLQHAARIIREGLLGMSASAARFEGAEFAVVLNNDSLDVVKTVVDQINQGALRTNFRDGDINIAVTLSGGLVRIQKSSSDVEPMSQASQALGAAKAAGNNRWYFFDGQKCVPLEQASVRKPGGAAEENTTTGSREQQPDSVPGFDRGKDRRAHRRQKCSGIYQVASYTPGIPPSEEDFLNTRVADVSAGGCALLLASPPSSKWFVVALKKPGEIVYVKAEVVHLKRARSEDAAAPLFIAGCRFTGRISAPAPRQELQEA